MAVNEISGRETLDDKVAAVDEPGTESPVKIKDAVVEVDEKRSDSGSNTGSDNDSVEYVNGHPVIRNGM